MTRWDLYGGDTRRRMRQAKVDAGWRCRACGRRRREHAWQVFRPDEIHAHHLFRRPGSPLWPLCESCHERTHRFDKRHATPLWLDTAAVVAFTRLARYAGWAALIVATVLVLKWSH